MNARLCSLLVAGGVVLAGIQTGSLSAAPSETEAAHEAAATAVTLQGASLDSLDGGSARLKLVIPGFTGTPKLQVLSNPLRVVVDLFGVNRGSQLTKKDLAALNHPLIQKYRVAQFAVSPQPVTRLVLEVVPGTHVSVSNQSSGVLLALTAGTGDVQARLNASPSLLSSPTQYLASPIRTNPSFQIQETKVAQDAPVLNVTSPLVVAVPTELVTVKPEPVAGVLPSEPLTLTTDPSPSPVSTDPKGIVPAEQVAVVTAPKPLTTLEPISVLPEVNNLIATNPKVALGPVPVVGAPYRLLPALTAGALMPTSLGPVPQDSKSRDRAIGGLNNGQPGGRTLGEQETRYTGAPMTIDVPSADLGTFLRIVADAMHLNLILDSDVQGTYNFKFTDTPADLILDMMLKNAGLGKEISHGVLRVAKVEKLQKEENDRKALDEAKALAGDLQSVTRPLSYAKVSEVKPILEKVLSKRGSLITDDRTNTLIITDLPRNLPLVDDLIAQLDVQIQQVEISARVVEANGSFDKAFGVKWPTNNSGDTSITTGGIAAPWGATNAPSWNSINSRPGPGDNSALFAFAPGRDGITSIPGAAAEYWVSFLTNRVSINFILQAAEKEGKVKIISQPKLVTQNNHAAKILSGQKIPYPTAQGGGGGAITVAFADANLQLDVTPQITNEGTIIMDINLTKAEADFGHTVNGTPTILQKSISTKVLVKDGGTAILGGVYTNNVNSGTAGVPFLNKLPLIGWLFRNRTSGESNAELLVFITPRIIKN